MENTALLIFLFSLLLYILASFLKQRLLSIVARSFVALGFLCNLFLIVKHIFLTHRLPLTNISETLLSTVSIIVLIFLAMELRKKGGNSLGLLVSLVSCMGLFAAFWIFKRPTMPLLPALQSKWLIFHVLSCIIAYCFFTISFITAIIFTIRGGYRESKAFAVKRISHRFVCIGFYMLTLGIILGSVWGKSAWGHWWNWDPKETWALITWLIYASYIYGRLFGNWSERRLAFIIIMGFAACLFTYFGVNFLLEGLHSYA